MQGLYNMFKTNDNLEQSGVYIDYGPNSKKVPIRILIARAGGSNTDFNKALEKSTRPYRKAIASGTLGDGVAEQLYKAAFIAHVIKGWEGVETKDGVELPFTPENVSQLLTDLPDLYTDLKEQSTTLAIFREDLLEADLGNSGRSSATDGSKAL